jgi:hypothetical protein
VVNQARKEMAAAQNGIPMTFFKKQPSQEFGH